MCKWLAILLLVLMPLQLSWAAVGAYCQHERGQAASHAGHHTHEHQPQAESDVPAGEKGVMPSADADCVTCHAGALALLNDLPFSLSDTGSRAQARSRSWSDGLFVERPERPQWTTLA